MNVEKFSKLLIFYASTGRWLGDSGTSGAGGSPSAVRTRPLRSPLSLEEVLSFLSNQPFAPYLELGGPFIIHCIINNLGDR